MPVLTPYPPQAMQLLKDLAADGDIIAAAQEPAIKTTQNSYAYYMSTLTQLAKLMPLGNLDHATSLHFWADVLIEAGGNEQGIRDALKAST